MALGPASVLDKSRVAHNLTARVAAAALVAEVGRTIASRTAGEAVADGRRGSAAVAAAGGLGGLGTCDEAVDVAAEEGELELDGVTSRQLEVIVEQVASVKVGLGRNDGGEGGEDEELGKVHVW